MAISVWRPFEEMLSLRDAMDRLFESSIVRPRAAGADLRLASIAVDMYETDEAIVIKSRAPGVHPDDLEITANEDSVTIKGHFGGESEDEEAASRRWLRHELWSGDFRRVIPLHTRVRLDKIDATFEHGLLTLTIPKTEEVKPKSIAVKVK